MMEQREIIRFSDLRRDFKVGGEFVTIMGTSGSGKSTLLNTLGCLDTPTSGEYVLDGARVRTMGKNERARLRNRKIGFVFQNYNLLPKTSAIENVELPLLYNPEISAAERRERAIKSLIAVGLGERLNHKSNQMSGGQQRAGPFPGTVPQGAHDHIRHPQSRTGRILLKKHRAARRKNHFRHPESVARIGQRNA